MRIEICPTFPDISSTIRRYEVCDNMGIQKRTRKFATTKRVISQRDARLKKNIVANDAKQEQQKKQGKGDELIREMYAPLVFVHTDSI